VLEKAAAIVGIGAAEFAKLLVPRETALARCAIRAVLDDARIAPDASTDSPPPRWRPATKRARPKFPPTLSGSVVGSPCPNRRIGCVPCGFSSHVY